ncbi:MAG: hypothetical protein JRI59_11345 [Deltaproteobacteria bacterium]|nr:hypothetical protein [Deltaproteobacteria bacterium]
MKRLAILVLAGLLVGLMTSGTRSRELASATKVATDGKVAHKAGQSASSPKLYTEWGRQEYQQQIGAQLREMREKMAELRDRLERAQPEVQAKLRKKLKKLEKLQEAARQKWEELKAASQQAWKDLKAELDQALEDLRQEAEEGAGEDQEGRTLI